MKHAILIVIGASYYTHLPLLNKFAINVLEMDYIWAKEFVNLYQLATVISIWFIKKM